MRHTKVDLAWGDGDYTFDIRPIGQIRELQELCDAGPHVIAHRLQHNTYRDEDVRETLRLGLIGAGMTPAKALALIKLHVDSRPWAENALPALMVMQAGIVGVSDDPIDDSVGEPTAEETNTSQPETASSPSPESTAPAQS